MLSVLRLGHRPQRDKRITTHVALVARAFGADEMLLVGSDPGIVSTVEGVADRFGGDFSVNCIKGYRPTILKWKERGPVVHLTMYGQELDDVIPKVRGKEVLLVVGAEKVPADIYELSDYNVGVGNQPHSEVAALAVFMDRFFEGGQLEKDFKGRMTVVPSERGKVVIGEE